MNASHSQAPDWGVIADAVRIIALRRLDDAAAAEDVAQEAVARAMAQLAAPGAAPVADIGGFVYGIARHLISDVYRARRRDVVSLDAKTDPAEGKPDVLERLVSHEERGRLRAALAELSPADRNLLRLSFVDGLGSEEVAERIRESAATIRKRKSRALERLRRALIGHEADPTPTQK